MFWFSDHHNREKMNRGMPWFKVKEHPDIFKEIDLFMPKLVESTDACGLFILLPENQSILRFASCLTRMNLRGMTVRIVRSEDYTRHPQIDYFQVGDLFVGDSGVMKGEIHAGHRYQHNLHRGCYCFGPFYVGELFLTKACYLLVSRSSPEIRKCFEGSIIQMADFYETMMLSAERFIPYFVHRLYPVLNTRIKTLMLSCAEKGIYLEIPIEIWLLIKSYVGWDHS